jgi:hypothetical protein
MITKYETNRWAKVPIQQRHFAKETEKTLIDLHGRKHAKIAQYHGFYDSWYEAKAALVEYARSKVEDAERHIASAQRELAQFEALVEPDAAEKG